MKVIPWTDMRTVPLVAMVMGIVTTGVGQVPGFVDEFDGPPLDSGWSLINPGGHDGFVESGHYSIRGPHGSSTGLRRSMGGEGDFTAEISLKLEHFFLSGAGGTQSDLKVRFTGVGAWLEVVLNSFQSLRVTSSELDGNLESPIIVRGIGDGDAFTTGSTLTTDWSSKARTPLSEP